MKRKKTRQAVVRTLALSVILAALTSMPPTVAASAKCRLSNVITVSGPGIWQAIEFRVELAGVRVLPGERMGVTPRGEEAFLGLPFTLSGGCIEVEYFGEMEFYRRFHGQPVVRQRGVWYYPDPDLAAIVERAITLAQLVSRVRVAGGL